MTNNFFGFDSKIIELADKAENLCDFSVTDKIKEYNTAKVLSAFINNRVSEQCFYGSSGYGYGDMGRETLDKVYVDRPDYKGWAMVIRNIHQVRTNVGYIVGTVSDHVLNVNGEDVSLRDLCGKNAPVRFNYEFWLV